MERRVGTWCAIHSRDLGTLVHFLRVRAMSQLWILGQRSHLASLDLGELQYSVERGFFRTPPNPGLTKPCNCRLRSLAVKPNKLFITSNSERQVPPLPHASYAPGVVIGPLGQAYTDTWLPPR